MITKEIRSLLLIVLPVILSCCNRADSIVKDYYKNGQVKIEAYEKNGKYDGQVKTYYEDGQLRSVAEWQKGTRNGLMTIYYQNGFIRDSVTYVNDKIHGYKSKFNGNGSIGSKGKIVNDYFYGDAYHYNNDYISSIDHIKKDTLHSFSTYDENGEMRDTWTIKINTEAFKLYTIGDTIESGAIFKARIVLNHLIADSIRIYSGRDNDFNKKLLFKWPEENGITYVYSKKSIQDYTQHFSGGVTFYYRRDLTTLKYAGKTETGFFNVEYFVKPKSILDTK